MDKVKELLKNGTVRRWSIGLGTIALVILNRAVGLGVEPAAEAMAVGLATAIILGSNYKDAKKNEADPKPADEIISGTTRRWVLGIGTMVLMTLNKRLSLNLDVEAQAEVAAVAGALILGSNYKEGKMHEAAAPEEAPG